LAGRARAETAKTGDSKKHTELVWEALNYLRNVGAEASAIRTFVAGNETDGCVAKDDDEALARLVDEGRVVRLGDRWFLSPDLHKEAESPALAPTWRPHDAWILLAILYCRASETCRLEHVIASADFINHAVPTFDELHGALNRLKDAGLIRASKGEFAATEKALAMFTRVEESRPKRVLAQLEGLRHLLDCPCCGIALKLVRWRVRLTEKDYEEALASYQESADPA
jgi:hypothetical protein